MDLAYQYLRVVLLSVWIAVRATIEFLYIAAIAELMANVCVGFIQGLGEILDGICND